MASSPIALSKESVLEIVNHKGFDLIITRHIKQSRFGRLDGQKIVCFVCVFEHKVNKRGIFGCCGPSVGCGCCEHCGPKAADLPRLVESGLVELKVPIGIKNQNYSLPLLGAVYGFLRV